MVLIISQLLTDGFGGGEGRGDSSSIWISINTRTIDTSIWQTSIGSIQKGRVSLRAGVRG